MERIETRCGGCGQPEFMFYDPNSPSLLEDVLAKIESELDEVEAKSAKAVQDATKQSDDAPTAADPVRRTAA